MIQSFLTEIQIKLEVRVTYSGEPGTLASILKSLRVSGGPLHAHLVYRLYDKAALFFVCHQPEEAALALQQRGHDVETETVLTVSTQSRPGLWAHLVETLEADMVDISYSYATVAGNRVMLVMRTNDNAKAEDLLRSYLLLSEGAG